MDVVWGAHSTPYQLSVRFRVEKKYFLVVMASETQRA